MRSGNPASGGNHMVSDDYDTGGAKNGSEASDDCALGAQRQPAAWRQTQGQRRLRRVEAKE